MSAARPEGSTSPSVVVTGASSGIGQATARLFAGRGFRVFGTSRRERADDDGIEMLELDVRSDASVERCAAELVRRAGVPDVLVNNAGVEHLAVAEETTLDEARAVFETNFFGVVRMTNALLPAMRARARGRIINIGSLAAWVGEPGEAFYSASKHALAGYTEALRHELWPLGIHVSIVEPGAFRTGIVESGSVTEGRFADYDEVRRAAEHTLRESARRGGDPRRVAAAVVRAALARTPKLRYVAGADGYLVPYLKVLLPQRLFDVLLRRGFGLRKR
ncbi:MAG TPA: SDR family NAD(P)-dependent oxidoreductase [Nannocystaceae bacterium]|nr:SDR family NAD(P)-dependent oxidoreductase [Nannocystaceae bacterium]